MKHIFTSGLHSRYKENSNLNFKNKHLTKPGWFGINTFVVIKKNKAPQYHIIWQPTKITICDKATLITRHNNATFVETTRWIVIRCRIDIERTGPDSGRM